MATRKKMKPRTPRQRAREWADGLVWGVHADCAGWLEIADFAVCKDHEVHPKLEPLVKDLRTALARGLAPLIAKLEEEVRRG